jgi:hypothetical protein
VAGNSLLLGSSTGVISLVDLEKFPLRLKDSTLSLLPWNPIQRTSPDPDDVNQMISL